MARRSLRASTQGIKKAKQAFLRKGWTQDYLATEVGLETRQPIWKFFAGKPVDRSVFTEICFRLDLEPDEIADSPQVDPLEEVADSVPESSNEVDIIATKARQLRHDQIQNQCGTLRLLDIARPVELDDLYVDVNILEEITSQRWLEISDLQTLQPDEFDRLSLSKVRAEGISGLQAIERYSKLMVLGKPGAGKTTFLQYLAVHCNQGELQPHCVPVFIRLNTFAEDALDEGNFSLINAINHDFSRSGISGHDVEILLNHGRILLLLDGLDEVPEAASDDVIKQIRKLAETYYKNPIIITCRIAAQEYRFRGFTEVEIADFKPAQIENFVKKWFVAVARNSPNIGAQKANLFLEQLALPENQPIQELATTPVLLNLTCLVFQAKGNFPAKRADLYKQGLDLLLVRWDESRGIRRDDAYRNLSLPHKLQLLSQIAAHTFERGEYFFEAETLQHLIANHLQTLSDTPTDSAALELNSLAILKSIEAQHGLLVERARQIYSFSHLTFQEYFAARGIVAGVPHSLPLLVSHITEKRYREVFLLTTQLLPNADSLVQLMQQATDALGCADATLHQFLNWVAQKSVQVNTPYKPAAVRAFYFTLAFPPDHRLANNQALTLAIDPKLASELGGELALDLALNHALAVASAMTPELVYDRLKALYLALDLQHLPQVELITEALEHLKNQLPECQANRDSIQQWWHMNGEAWVAQFRNVLQQQRNIGHQWHWDHSGEQHLEQYTYVNQLLVECLNSKGQITPSVRQGIEEGFLLPKYPG